MVGVSAALSVGLSVALSWLVEIWAQVMFPPNFHRYILYPTDRVALGYDLTTSKPGSSMGINPNCHIILCMRTTQRYAMGC